MDPTKITSSSSTKSKRCQELKVSYNSFLFSYPPVGLKKKDVLKFVEEAATSADQKGPNDTSIIGKEYFRNPEVNMGFYSKKRQGVADVDPKVSL